VKLKMAACLIFDRALKIILKLSAENAGAGTPAAGSHSVDPR
jgi:hypothetical protein